MQSLPALELEPIPLVSNGYTTPRHKESPVQQFEDTRSTCAPEAARAFIKRKCMEGDVEFIGRLCSKYGDLWNEENSRKLNILPHRFVSWAMETERTHLVSWLVYKGAPVWEYASLEAAARGNVWAMHCFRVLGVPWNAKMVRTALRTNHPGLESIMGSDKYGLRYPWNTSVNPGATTEYFGRVYETYHLLRIDPGNWKEEDDIIFAFMEPDIFSK